MELLDHTSNIFIVYVYYKAISFVRTYEYDMNIYMVISRRLRLVGRKKNEIAWHKI